MLPKQRIPKTTILLYTKALVVVVVELTTFTDRVSATTGTV